MMSRREWLVQMLQRHEKCSHGLLARLKNIEDADLECLATEDSRKAYNMAREVSGEMHRMVSYIRFQLHADRVLWAEARPRHLVEDVVMEWLGKRYRCFGLVLCTKRGYFVLWPGGDVTMKPSSARREDVLDDVASHVDDRVWWDDSGEGLWETFYDSQFIQSRKNLPLFHKVLPKACLNTFPGLVKEKRGVGGTTLDNYIEEG